MALSGDALDPVGGAGVADGAEALPVPASATDVVAPIVVANTLWTPADPAAYRPGTPGINLEITHLRELEEAGIGRHDDARWGALEVVPAKADLILDLIRATASGPPLGGSRLRDRDDVHGDEPNDIDRGDVPSAQARGRRTSSSSQGR